MIDFKRAGQNIVRRIFVESKIMKDITWAIWTKIVAMIFFFLTDIAIARLLTTQEYGEWAFFYSIKTMMAYFCYFGIDHSTKLIIARIEKADEKRSVFRIALMVRTIINILFAIFIWILGEQLVHLIEVDNMYSGFKFYIRFGGCLAAFNAFQEFFKAVGYGLRDAKLSFDVTLCEFLSSFVFVVIGVLSFRDGQGALYGYILSGVVTLIASLLIFQKKHSLLSKPQQKYDNKQNIISIFKFAIPLLLANIANLISLEFDTVMLGVLNSSDQVAIYNIGKKICTKAGQINLAIATGSMASFAIINCDNAKKKLDELRKLEKINLFTTVGVGVCLIPFAIWGIPIVYGARYLGAVKIMLWFIPFYLMYGISTFYTIFMDYRGKSTARSMYSIVAILSNVVLNYIFIPKYGAVGAVWTTLITQGPYVIYVIICSARLVKHIKNLNNGIG